MLAQPPQELFLSHATEDAAFAERLAAVLRWHGVPVWFSRTNLLGGQQWHDEIGAALERCDWLAVILSNNSVNSFWVKRELVFALKQARLVGRITPVLLEPCSWERFSWTLVSCQMLDFSANFDVGCQALLRSWGIGFQPSTL